jgi:DNA-binding NtrC family response regulator
MKTQILVVDDEADLELLIKQKFRRKIRENVYEFRFAANGEEALASLAENPGTDIILSDINMPVMDGLTLLTHLPEVSGVAKAVMVSAYGDLQNIRTAMNRGAFDFVTKPVDFTDLELTMEKTAAHVLQLRETLRAIQENNILKMYVDETVINFMGRPTLRTRSWPPRRWRPRWCSSISAASRPCPKFWLPMPWWACSTTTSTRW